MTRWLRFLLTLVRSAGRSRLRLDQESLLHFRVWPTDADLSMMNHAAYLTVMEQGRVDFILRTGFMRLLLKRHWAAVLGSVAVQFRKPLRRFQRFQLRTRVGCWDTKWIYLEQRIDRGGDLVACAIVKIAILSADGRLEPADLLVAFDHAVASPAIPHAVHVLDDGERLMNERLREWPALDWSSDGRAVASS